MSAPDTPLLAVLRARGLLSPQEEAMLRSPEVLALEPRAQLDHVSTNRRVGFFVTAIAGGLRLTLLAAALPAHLVLIASGAVAFAWWAPLMWLVLAALLVWLVPPFVRRVKTLGRPLPSYDELGRPS